MEYIGSDSDRLSVMPVGNEYTSDYAPDNILTIGDRTFEVTIVYRDDAGRVVDTQGINETTTKVQDLARKLFQEANIADNQNYVIINGEGVHTPETDNEILERYREDFDGPLETLSPDDHPILNTWTTLYEEITGTRTVLEDLSFEERRDTFPTFEAFEEKFDELCSSMPNDQNPIWALYNIKWGNRNGNANYAYEALERICDQENIEEAAARMIRENDLKLQVHNSDDDDLDGLSFVNADKVIETKDAGYPFSNLELDCLEKEYEEFYLK